MKYPLLVALGLVSVLVWLAQGPDVKALEQKAAAIRQDHQAFFADLDAVMQKHPQLARKFRVVMMGAAPGDAGKEPPQADVEVHSVTCVSGLRICWPDQGIL